MPRDVKRADICMTPWMQGVGLSCVAPCSIMEAKKVCAKTAPSLPMPALKPCPLERTRVGKILAGTVNVVAFGPKVKKNCASTYSARRSALERLRHAKPNTRKTTVRIAKPPIWMGFRPITSMVKMVKMVSK